MPSLSRQQVVDCLRGLKNSLRMRVSGPAEYTEALDAAIAYLSREPEKARVDDCIELVPAADEDENGLSLYREPAQPEPEKARADDLTPEECHELFSLGMASGMRPPEIDEAHPYWTAMLKLGRRQSPDEPAQP